VQERQTDRETWQRSKTGVPGSSGGSTISCVGGQEFV